jgi:hypothetical protein
MKSIDRCDSEDENSKRGARCPNRGEYYLTHAGILSGQEITLFLCRKHYQDGGMRHIDAPRGRKPTEGAPLPAENV